MNLSLSNEGLEHYKSAAQIARVITERWTSEHCFCPKCGAPNLESFPNNRPVADFYCGTCEEQYELKSKNSARVGKKIVDGAYETMMQRVQSDTNPNFFFLTYDKTQFLVRNFLIIPKYYFTPALIEQRKPLRSHAKRAGWVGCNINISSIPESGRIYVVRQSQSMGKDAVCAQWKATEFLSQQSLAKRGWLLDIMSCLDRIHKSIFSLNEVYAFETELQAKYPNNHFIKDKIRQQLQQLRDSGVIEFKSRGNYKKVIK